MGKAPRKQGKEAEPKRVAIACQGGGIHAAFEVGVLTEILKDIQEKKLRVLMTKEFDRLREVAQVDNFLAGTSQSGGRTAGPVGLVPNNQQSPRTNVTPPSTVGTGIARPTGQPVKSGFGPGSATLPRPSGAQAR